MHINTEVIKQNNPTCCKGDLMRSIVKGIVYLLFLLTLVFIDIYISEAQVDPSISACYPNESAFGCSSAYTCSAEKGCSVLMVTGIEFDKDSGLVRFTHAGGISSGQTYYLCDIDFIIFCGGQFCAIALGGGHFSPEMVQFLISIPPCGTCDLVVNTAPSEVWPQKTGNDDKTTATIMISTTKPAPPEGCTVDLKVEPVENSGGHSHSGNRLKGTVIPATLTIPGGSSGAASAEYKASEVAGEEKIIAEIKGVKKGEATIQVKVPGLSGLGGGGTYIDATYRLTGSTGTHPSNHYGTDSAIVSTNYMADDFYEQFNATLGINDMSLAWGGLFDIDGDWSTPHNSHRKGTSVDIDRCAMPTNRNNPNPRGDCPNGWIQVDRDEIERICEYRGGYLEDESTIHCEFSGAGSLIIPIPPIGGGGGDTGGGPVDGGQIPQ